MRILEAIGIVVVGLAILYGRSFKVIEALKRR
jgi:hypothetical protein